MSGLTLYFVFYWLQQARRPWTLTHKSRWFPNSVIIFIITASLFAIVSFREIWPFSRYPMFKSVQRNPLVRTRLCGVTTNSEQDEVPLLPSYISPLGEPELVQAFRRLKRREDGQEQLELAVADCLRRYEKHRINGDHSGPPAPGHQAISTYMGPGADGK